MITNIFSWLVLANYGGYIKKLLDVDYVLDTLGEKELEKEFKILKPGGTLVSLKGLPNQEFAVRMGFSKFKQMLFKFAGRKFDKMAQKKESEILFHLCSGKRPAAKENI